MDVQIEKKNIIARLDLIDDEELIMRVKDVLDDNIEQDFNNEMLNQSIDRGLEQSRNDKVKPHAEVMGRLRAKYKK